MKRNSLGLCIKYIVNVYKYQNVCHKKQQCYETLGLFDLMFLKLMHQCSSVQEAVAIFSEFSRYSLETFD